jgi:hypothetical protein
MDFAKAYLSVVCDGFEQPDDILSWKKLKKRNLEFKNQGLGDQSNFGCSFDGFYFSFHFKVLMMKQSGWVFWNGRFLPCFEFGFFTLRRSWSFLRALLLFIRKLVV